MKKENIQQLMGERQDKQKMQTLQKLNIPNHKTLITNINNRKSYSFNDNNENGKAEMH